MEKEYKEWLKNRTFLHGLPTVEPPMWLHKCYGCGRKTIWVNYDKWGRKNITENNGSKCSVFKPFFIFFFHFSSPYNIY